jgi:hypothetical protein
MLEVIDLQAFSASARSARNTNMRLSAQPYIAGLPIISWHCAAESGESALLAAHKGSLIRPPMYVSRGRSTAEGITATYFQSVTAAAARWIPEGVIRSSFRDISASADAPMTTTLAGGAVGKMRSRSRRQFRAPNSSCKCDALL